MSEVSVRVAARLQALAQRGVDDVLNVLVAIVATYMQLGQSDKAFPYTLKRVRDEQGHELAFHHRRGKVLVILPQALRLVIPGIVNSFISLFKDTSLVFIMGLYDLLGIARLITTSQDWLGHDIESYIFAAFGFWIFCFAMSRYSQGLERRLARAQKR